MPPLGSRWGTTARVRTAPASQVPHIGPCVRRYAHHVTVDITTPSPGRTEFSFSLRGPGRSHPRAPPRTSCPIRPRRHGRHTSAPHEAGLTFHHSLPCFFLFFSFLFLFLSSTITWKQQPHYTAELPSVTRAAYKGTSSVWVRALQPSH